jgi:hypothetical protein
MQLFLKTVGATHRLVLPEDAPISAVKDAVEDITFIPSQLQVGSSWPCAKRRA